jgi:hypothetical protein
MTKGQKASSLSETETLNPIQGKCAHFLLSEKQNFESTSCNEEVTEILYQDGHSFCLASRKARFDGEHKMCCFSSVLISGRFVRKDRSVVYKHV